MEGGSLLLGTDDKSWGYGAGRISHAGATKDWGEKVRTLDFRRRAMSSF